MRREYGVMLDFDGLLINMSPFSGELADGPRRWHRFFARTPDADPIDSGLALVDELSSLGWFYTVSTTRPAWTLSIVRRWLSARMPVPPAAVYARNNPSLEPAVCKATHYWRSRRFRRGAIPSACTLFIDDEFAIVDELRTMNVPALHVSAIAMQHERDLLSTLRHSRKMLFLDEQHRRAKARQAG